MRLDASDVNRERPFAEHWYAFRGHVRCMEYRTVVINADPNPEANTSMSRPQPAAARGGTVRQPAPRPQMPRQPKERVRTLERLFELFRDHDAADEIRRLKEQDEGF